MRYSIPSNTADGHFPTRRSWVFLTGASSSRPSAANYTGAHERRGVLAQPEVFSVSLGSITDEVEDEGEDIISRRGPGGSIRVEVSDVGGERWI
ncbi:hypothetical protein APHAL10511_006616 [Amanita phalloides]|nr:hypothetical protein APHAL10511_006616 [Amanita phalloides]